MRLQITSAGKTWEYAPPEHKSNFTAGRREGNEIVLPDDPAVSNMHVRIDRFLNDWTFTDQMSDSGTLHNGQAQYSGTLNQGDELRLGNSTLKVLSLAAQPPASPPARPAPAPAQPPAQFLPPSAPISAQPRKESYAKRNERRAAIKDKGWQTVIKPSGRKDSNAGKQFFAVLVLIAICGGIAAYWLLQGSGYEPGPAYKSTAEPERKAEVPTNKASPDVTPPLPKKPSPKDEEAAYRKRIDDIEMDKTRPPHERIAELEDLSAELTRLKLHSLEFRAQRARDNVSLELSREMQNRYGEDNRAVYQLLQKNDYRAAIERIQFLDDYCNLTSYHKHWAHRHDIDRYIERERANIERRNTEWIGQQMNTVDEALSRNDYAPAADTLEGVASLAVLPEAVEAALAAEVVRFKGLLSEQDMGRIEPPRKPFDSRKDRLPPAPKSAFLPSGEYSSQRQESLPRSRLVSLAGDSEFAGLAIKHFKHDATLTGYASGKLSIIVKRPLNDAPDWTYSTSVAPHALWPATRVRIYEQMPEQTLNIRVATLMLCFDNGLLDDAARVACSFRNAHPEHKVEIDVLLATKLGIDVPEGGFIERDGKLVAK